MKKPNRAQVQQPKLSVLSSETLATVTGGTDAKPAPKEKPKQVDGTWKLGNKVWMDDWMAPV